MSEHDRFERLLPWLVNGTLGDPERRQLEEHLASCLDCREALEECRRLAAGLARAEPPEPAPHPAQLARLVERIRSGEADRETAEDRSGLGGRPSRHLWRSTPRAARWLVGAQAAALLLALGLLAERPGETDAARFRTLSTAEAPAARAQVRVVFAPEASEAEIRHLLLQARAEIVGGPSPLGAYALALGPASAGESAASVIDLLRADPHVRLAEPVEDPLAPSAPPASSAADVARP